MCIANGRPCLATSATVVRAILPWHKNMPRTYGMHLPHRSTWTLDRALLSWSSVQLAAARPASCPQCSGRCSRCTARSRRGSLARLHSCHRCGAHVYTNHGHAANFTAMACLCPNTHSGKVFLPVGCAHYSACLNRFCGAAQPPYEHSFASEP